MNVWNLTRQSRCIEIVLFGVTQGIKLSWASWYEGFPDSSVGKESACNAVDLCLNPGLERSLEKG